MAVMPADDKSVASFSMTAAGGKKKGAAPRPPAGKKGGKGGAATGSHATAKAIAPSKIPKGKGKTKNNDDAGMRSAGIKRGSASGSAGYNTDAAAPKCKVP